MKKVGVLGGMGPEATILLMQKIINGVEATDDSDHIPLVVHQNTLVPSRIKALIDGTGKSPLPMLKLMASELENMGCDFLVMPCNTAHYYHKHLSDTISIPFLNMVELAVHDIFQKRQKKIGILASPAVRRVGVFDLAFEKYGLVSLFPEDDFLILHLIKEIKRNLNSSETIRNLNVEAAKLMNKGCDGILIACTEFSLLSQKISNKNLTDTLDCLTKAAISKALY